MSGDVNCGTVDRQRMRTLALLDSERIKLQALQQQFQSGEEESASIYQELIEEQEQTIENLEQEVQNLTDQLEGPGLRQRLAAKKGRRCKERKALFTSCQRSSKAELLGDREGGMGDGGITDANRSARPARSSCTSAWRRTRGRSLGAEKAIQSS